MAEGTFLLKFLAPETGCSAHEVRFTAPVEDIAKFLDTDSNHLENHIFWLDDEALDQLSQMLAAALPRPDGEVMLCRPHPIDATPYLVHTNFELPLMLDGRKPLSVFLDAVSSESLAATRSHFNRHVEAGTVIERVVPLTMGGVDFTHVLYSLPGEEWRFEAYIELMARERPWTDEMERELGSLLGYSDAQCDWWINERNSKRVAAALPSGGSSTA